VGSRLVASPSHGTSRKIAIWTSTSGLPPVTLSMYLRRTEEILSSGTQEPNQRTRGLKAILPSSFLSLPVALP
jgi:hypothetical protein